MSVGILGTVSKQSDEVKGVNFDYTAFLADKVDTISSAVVTADAGVTVVSYATLGSVVRALISGGTSGSKYKIKCRATTVGGLIEDAEIQVSVKDT